MHLRQPSKMTTQEYKRTLEDEMDWSLIDQLHKAVLQISSFCFRTKQICLTVTVAVIALLAKFTNNELDQSIFVAGYLIPLFFWFLDGVAYFYQVKLRGIMDDLRVKIRERHSVLSFSSIDVIDDTRTDALFQDRARDAFFNHSMWLYAILICINTLALFLFGFGLIA